MNKLSDSTNLLIFWILVTILAPIVSTEVALVSVNDMSVHWTVTLLIELIVWGILLGVGQWAILRTRLKKVWLWIPFTAIAFPCSYVFGPLVHDGRDDYLIMSMVPGIVLGIFQWLVLYKKVKNSIWWIPASILSWTIGIFFSEEYYDLISLEQFGWDPPLQLGVMLGIFLGIPVGVLSGIAIAFLLRRTNITQTITPQVKTSQDVLPN